MRINSASINSQAYCQVYHTDTLVKSHAHVSKCSKNTKIHPMEISLHVHMHSIWLQVHVYMNVPMYASHTIHTYPMCIMSSTFSTFPVHIAILSPLPLICTTDPHTSSLLSSNPSPIRHISWRVQYVCVRVCVYLYAQDMTKQANLWFDYSCTRTCNFR